MAPARVVVVVIVIVAVLAGVAAVRVTTGGSRANPKLTLTPPVPDRDSEASISNEMDTVLARTLPTSAPETTAPPPPPTSRPVPDPAPALVAAVTKAGGVPLSATTRCPEQRLEPSYVDPGPGWAAGAYIAPLGPVPDGRSATVSAVVRCTGAHHAYVGVEGVWDGTTWNVSLVPDVADAGEGAGANLIDTAPLPPPVKPGTPITGRADGPDIEGYATYQPQTTCDPRPKPGAVALRDLLLSHYPSTGSLGISRNCDAGGRSEHKEGRAFDWRADVTVAAQRAAVEDALTRMFATDSRGRPFAFVRRMGLLYIIWNHRIWSVFRADVGWRAYYGSSTHTDHVHFSLSPTGGAGATSFWSGTVVTGLPDHPIHPDNDNGVPCPSLPCPTTTTRPTATTTTAAPRTTSTTAFSRTTTGPGPSTTTPTPPP